VASDRGDIESVVEVRRRAGKLRAIRTSLGRSFLVLRDPLSERYLTEGAELGPDDVAALEGPLARTAGMALAYRLLAVRDRTEREIRGALEKEEIRTPEVVGDIVDTLRRQGYLDDRRLAENFVRFTMRHKPSGPRLLRRKLREAGVREEIIEEELHEELGPERERELARELARKKMKGITDREKAVRRVHGFLSRRGFSERIVNGICVAILRGTRPGENDEED
jgi:SOS response regulatory protein OraA/RecX